MAAACSASTTPPWGREGKWGEGTLVKVSEPKSVLVVGGGPAGLEYARVAAARGHNVTLYEAEGETGGHVRVQSLLPTRAEFGEIGRWLAAQAEKNGTRIVTGAPVTEEDLDQALEAVKPDHVVVATGSSVAVDGFQGWTSEGLPGWETGNCVGWDTVAQGQAKPRGKVMVLDDLCDVVGPLTAVACKEGGADEVTLVTRWPMIGMETILDVYLDWDPAQALPDRGDGLRRPLRPPHRGQRGDALQRPPRRGRAGHRRGLDRNGDRPAL